MVNTNGEYAQKLPLMIKQELMPYLTDSAFKGIQFETKQQYKIAFERRKKRKGSTHLDEILLYAGQNRPLVICDGPVHLSGKNKFILAFVAIHMLILRFTLQKTFTQQPLRGELKSCDDVGRANSFNEE
jgi:hypothetical protein